MMMFILCILLFCDVRALHGALSFGNQKFPLTLRPNWFHPIQLICRLAPFREILSEGDDDVDIYPM